MRVVEACSDAAECGAAFVRPHYTPHITEEHSAATGTAPAQSTPYRIKWIRRHGPFHHVAYAASYTAGTATRQATPSYAASYAWRRFDKTGQGHAGRRICAGQRIHADKARKSGNKISVACNAIMLSAMSYIILRRWAHLSGTQLPCTHLS